MLAIYGNMIHGKSCGLIPVLALALAALAIDVGMAEVIEGFSQYKDLGQVREVAEKACRRRN